MMQRKRERRKVLWAVLASLVVHFVVAYSLAAFSGSTAPAAPEEDKPVELTLVDLATPPPVVPKNPAFVETNEKKKSADKPKEQTFESNENSIAASSVPAAGEAPLPSQQGKDRPFINLETQQYSLPTEGIERQQLDRKSEPPPGPTAVASARPSEPPKPSATAAPAVIPEPEQLAMLTSTPPPPLKSPDEAEPSATPEIAATPPEPAVRPQPARAASDYQAQKEQTRITGRITDRGPSAVNAVGTPLGRYQKAVSDAIGSRWYYYMKRKSDLFSIGTAHVEAEVDAEGHVQNLRVLSNNANEAFANVCLQSFQEAKLPPIPPDLAAALPGGRMPVDFYFTMYPN